MTSIDQPSPTARPMLSLSALIGRVRAILADRSDNRIAQKMAGTAFLVRVGSAVLALASQVLLARWMGAHEFGIFIYVWTWVLMIGALSDLGLSSAARRFIPEYAAKQAFDNLRGFLIGSCWLAFGIATLIGAAGALIVLGLRPWLNDYTIVPLFLACATIPIYGLVQVQSGIAQSYDWQNLALMPFYIWRQLAITAAVGVVWLCGYATDAVTTMIIAVAATWAVTFGQSAVLYRGLRGKVPAGPRRYEPKLWVKTSLPIFMVEAFYLLLTYVDILALEHFRNPDEVAAYYAAARILAIVAFVYFAIAGATTHKFTEYHVAGDRERLGAFFTSTVRWTFWPSLAASAGILAFGWPLLALFGKSFTAAYPVMFILAIGMLARASIGPAERLLNMLGQQNICAAIYAGAFVVNLAGCLLLIPRFGIEGAAVSLSFALVAESALLYIVTRQRLGIHAFVLGGKTR
ncbi:MAG: lipopolysaccharide biosynthesis protein [Xanthobacteraceae bacterium]|uniref:lipopolysaccharide biosynthesis protein n=1 Tax=Pseudolabrys sp. TaxID=1960880 RepID=UPI003D0B8F26